MPALAAPVHRDEPTVIEGLRIAPPPDATLETDTKRPAAWVLRGERAELRRVDRVPFEHAWRRTGARLTEERVEMIGAARVVLADLGPSALLVGTARDAEALDLLLGAIDPGTERADTVLTLGRDPFLSPLLP